MKPTLPNPVINCDSSDSSADEVVFTGRVPLWRRQVRSRVVNDPPAASSTAQRTPPKRSHDAVDRRDTGIRRRSGTSRRRMSPRRVVLEFGNDSADSDAVADYLANLIGDDSSDSSDGWSDDEQPSKAVTPKTPGMSGPDDVDEEEEGSSSGDEDKDDEEDDGDIDIDSDMQWMSDEQLAHLLDTGDIPDMDADEIDFFTTHGFARSGAAAASGRNKKNKKKDKRKNASLREPISASKLADMFEEDPYGAFDIMDYNRTSLMGKKARGKMPDFDLSDSELESNIHASWENDRRKKKAKKLEREELRAQGLLGKSGKARPRGNTPDDIRDEIRSFMMSRTQTYVSTLLSSTSLSVLMLTTLTAFNFLPWPRKTVSSSTKWPTRSPSNPSPAARDTTASPSSPKPAARPPSTQTRSTSSKPSSPAEKSLDTLTGVARGHPVVLAQVEPAAKLALPRTWTETSWVPLRLRSELITVAAPCWRRWDGTRECRLVPRITRASSSLSSTSSRPPRRD